LFHALRPAGMTLKRTVVHAIMEGRRSGLKAWPLLAVFIIQVLLFLAHWFLFHTWIAFWPGLDLAVRADLRTALFVLSFSFIAAALLSFRFSNFAITFFYKIAAIWLGFLNYFFYAACLSWLAWYAILGLRVAHAATVRPVIAAGFFVLAILITVFGMLNAFWIRVRRVVIHLRGLPPAWRGRRAVLMSDLHLGNVNGAGFCRRVLARAASLRPDIVFIPGDVFDGTKGDLDRMIAPFRDFAPPLGIYFSTGNHEEFHDTVDYLKAIGRAGIRILTNERVTVDGLHILGIPYHESTYPIRARATLESLSPGTEEASILLNHAPVRLPIVEQSGIGLQLSGHTHGGQIFPYTWLTHRIFGRFTHGLHSFGALQVYTSTGAGTWGPPMRVGAQPEIVVLEFE
jgi:uncharacterized protein